MSPNNKLTHIEQPFLKRNSSVIPNTGLTSLISNCAVLKWNWVKRNTELLLYRTTLLERKWTVIPNSTLRFECPLVYRTNTLNTEPKSLTQHTGKNPLNIDVKYLKIELHSLNTVRNALNTGLADVQRGHQWGHQRSSVPQAGVRSPRYR